jgi:hypothetical protein
METRYGILRMPDYSSGSFYGLEVEWEVEEVRVDCHVQETRVEATEENSSLAKNRGGIVARSFRQNCWPVKMTIKRTNPSK